MYLRNVGLKILICSAGVPLCHGNKISIARTLRAILIVLRCVGTTLGSGEPVICGDTQGCHGTGKTGNLKGPFFQTGKTQGIC